MLSQGCQLQLGIFIGPFLLRDVLSQVLAEGSFSSFWKTAASENGGVTEKKKWKSNKQKTHAVIYKSVIPSAFIEMRNDRHTLQNGKPLMIS